MGDNPNIEKIIIFVLYGIFVIIVLNGIMVKKTNQTIKEAENDISKDKFCRVLFKYLFTVPIILIIYFFILLLLIGIIKFCIFILLDSERNSQYQSTAMNNQGQSDSNNKDPFEIFGKKIKHILLTFILLWVLNIFLLIFILLFMVVCKKKDDRTEKNINNGYINNVLNFYKFAFLILSFISYHYIGMF